MALNENFRKLLERSPASYLEEQIRKLYMRLYPFFTKDFVHIQDLQVTLGQINTQLVELRKGLIAHTHLAAGTPTSTAATAIGAIAPATLTQAAAESLIVPGGVPQPTGEGIAQIPSRVGPLSDIIATPPLDPGSLV